MKMHFPETKAEAQELLAKLGDYVDGVEDGKFDARAVAKRAGADLVDDLGENLCIVGATIALWEALQTIWGWL